MSRVPGGQAGGGLGRGCLLARRTGLLVLGRGDGRPGFLDLDPHRHVGGGEAFLLAAEKVELSRTQDAHHERLEFLAWQARLVLTTKDLDGRRRDGTVLPAAGGPQEEGCKCHS